MATAAATGCYKCGRVGHWSKDCPSSSGVGKPGESPGSRPASNTAGESGAGHAGSGGRGDSFQSTFGRGGKYVPGAGRGQGTGGRIGSRMAEGSGVNTGEQPPVEKVVLKRPKVDPDLLLSSDGIAYVKEKFQKMVIIKGPGHEVGDLKRLLEAYSQWHCRLFPSLTFPEFITKVEKVGATKRVRMSLRDMRDGIDVEDSPGGADACRPEENGNAAPSQTAGGANGETDTVSLDGSGHGGGPDEDDIFQDVPEDVFEEAFQQATGEASAPSLPVPPPPHATPIPAVAGGGLSAEQKVRIEANRQLAIERIRARTAAAAQLRVNAQTEVQEGKGSRAKDLRETATQDCVGGGDRSEEREEGSGISSDEGGGQRDAVAAPKRVLKILGTGIATSGLGDGEDGKEAEREGCLDSLHPKEVTSDDPGCMAHAADVSGEGESERGGTESCRAVPGGAADDILGKRGRSADQAEPQAPAGCEENEGEGEGNAREGGEVEEVAPPPKILEKMKIPGIRQSSHGNEVEGSGTEKGDVEGDNKEVAPGQQQEDMGGAEGLVEEGGEMEKVGGRGGKRRKVAIDDDDW